jgi:hypothetical protein
MRRRRRTRTFATLFGVTALALMVGAATASASFHLMRIRAVFEGVPGTSFVELEMIAPGQTFVNGQTLDIYNNVNNLHSTFNLNHDVANGENQRTILISENTSSSPDFQLSSGSLHTGLQQAAGAVCYSSIDCVSWGAFTNNGVLPSPAGTPLSGLGPSMVAIRGISRGCATALDEADDTNDGSDFTFGFFPPRNNAAAPIEVPCSTGTTTPAKKKCKKHKKSATSAKKKKCKKKKR